MIVFGNGSTVFLFFFFVDTKAFVLKLNFWWSSLMHDAHPADPECISKSSGCSKREHLGQRGPGSLVSTQEHCSSMWHFAFCLGNAFSCHNWVTAKIFFLFIFYNVQKRKKGSIKMYIRIILSTFLLKLQFIKLSTYDFAIINILNKCIS